MTRGVLMTVSGDDKELEKSTQHLQVVNETFKDGVSGEEHGLHEDDELKVNGIAEEVKVGQGATVEGPAVQHIPQQQPQGAIVCWERFLHIRSLRVLLVENDDCTRQIVTALLRNCSYEVIETANGLQAWKMLEDLTNHIDLVLTEVAMPFLSGTGLLCKIMRHKTRKNLPVIMMSSHDSMALVFKCLSKGAVDFLVKPIRKNELKNLWQHVWRRCHSSSGSGSESGTQTQKSVQSKRLEKSDNNIGSNDEDNNGSVGLSIRNGSDNGSGTQSSWTKQVVEADSPKKVPQWDQIAKYSDSTYAQVIHSNTEICGNKMVPTATNFCPEQKEQHVAELKVDSSRELELSLDYRNEVPVKTADAEHNIPLDIGSSKFTEQIGSGRLNLNCENPLNKPRVKGPLVSDATNGSSDSQMHDGEFEAPYERSKPSGIDNKTTNTIEELPALELSLKRLRGVKDAGITIQNERNVIRCSDLSSFSRFNASSNTKSSPIGCIGTESNSPHDKTLEVTNRDSPREIQSHSSGNPPPGNSNGVSNNIDMGSTTNKDFTKTAVISEPVVTSTAKHLYQSSALQSKMSNLICTSQQVILRKKEDMTATTMIEPRGDTHKVSPTQDFHHHFENHNSIAIDMQHQLPPDHEDSTLKEMAAAAPHCGSSNAVELLVEGNIGNYSVNRSASGSNNGSNGQNGSSTAVNAIETNIESDNGIARNSGSGDASGSRNGSGKESANRVDQNETSKGEAALTIFHQKRKESCFRQKIQTYLELVNCILCSAASLNFKIAGVTSVMIIRRVWNMQKKSWKMKDAITCYT
ncbi:two-component response regulator-like APRR7 isoform X1 [Senna tora]|uniref:Two-component response regulator-like APRR7 isoform X1 n=1 Tax=Senna tora TaxID=362788 RepID=A0A834TCE8_9FABA|nr:two-component response regulator-like APRR7 isoform X1 [Senna tora]